MSSTARLRALRLRRSSPHGPDSARCLSLHHLHIGQGLSPPVLLKVVDMGASAVRVERDAKPTVRTAETNANSTVRMVQTEATPVQRGDEAASEPGLRAATEASPARCVADRSDISDFIESPTVGGGRARTGFRAQSPAPLGGPQSPLASVGAMGGTEGVAGPRPGGATIATLPTADATVTSPRTRGVAITTPRTRGRTVTTPRIRDGAVTTPRTRGTPVTTPHTIAGAATSPQSPTNVLFPTHAGRRLTGKSNIGAMRSATEVAKPEAKRPRSATVTSAAEVAWPDLAAVARSASKAAAPTAARSIFTPPAPSDDSDDLFLSEMRSAVNGALSLLRADSDDSAPDGDWANQGAGGRRLGLAAGRRVVSELAELAAAPGSPLQQYAGDGRRRRDGTTPRRTPAGRRAPTSSHAVTPAARAATPAARTPAAPPPPAARTPAAPPPPVAPPPRAAPPPPTAPSPAVDHQSPSENRRPPTATAPRISPRLAARRQHHLAATGGACCSAATVVVPEPDDDMVCTQPVTGLVLDGVVAFVDVRSGADNRSRPVETQLRALGAVVSDRLTKTVTHVVFKDGSRSTFDRARRDRLRLVSALWVEACRQQLEHVNENLYPPAAAERYDSPLSRPRMRKMRSMQPKDFQEEEAAADRRLRRKRRRKERMASPPPAKRLAMTSPGRRTCRGVKELLTPKVGQQRVATDSGSEDDLPLSVRLFNRFMSPHVRWPVASDRPTVRQPPAKVTGAETASPDLSANQRRPKRTSSAHLSDSGQPAAAAAAENVVSTFGPVLLSSTRLTEDVRTRRSPPPPSPPSSPRKRGRPRKRPQSDTATKNEPEGQARPQPDPKPQAEADSQPDAGPQSQVRPQPDPESQSQALPQLDPKPQSQSGLQLDPQSRSQDDPQPDPKSQPQSGKRRRRRLLTPPGHGRAVLSEHLMQPTSPLEFGAPPPVTAAPAGQRPGRPDRGGRRRPADVRRLPAPRRSSLEFARPRPPVRLVLTNLHRSERDTLLPVLRRLGGVVVADQVGVSTTHVISGQRRRTLSVLGGLALGAWLLPPAWALASLEAGRWLSETSFEQAADWPAARPRRLARAPPSLAPTGGAESPPVPVPVPAGRSSLRLLAAAGAIYISGDTSPPPAALAAVARLAGAVVVPAARGASVAVGRHCRGVPTVNEQWLMDSLQLNRLLPLQHYLVSTSERR